ncbi:unnamed protein product [Ambrosiozyma monospora]|uniref:Unnamed protein product n=1 Tax=Ambrosiozyma monospora TaxID=43982 RepID=A0ACB5TAP8_AMBMO|nr:unnamed protein product [Ambrosiozyma monospora]
MTHCAKLNRIKKEKLKKYLLGEYRVVRTRSGTVSRKLTTEVEELLSRSVCFHGNGYVSYPQMLLLMDGVRKEYQEQGVPFPVRDDTVVTKAIYSVFLRRSKGLINKFGVVRLPKNEVFEQRPENLLRLYYLPLDKKLTGLEKLPLMVAVNGICAKINCQSSGDIKFVPTTSHDEFEDGERAATLLEAFTISGDQLPRYGIVPPDTTILSQLPTEHVKKWGTSKTGMLTKDAFYNYLKVHLIPEIQRQKHKEGLPTNHPTILLLPEDELNLPTYVSFLCARNDINIQVMPPNTTHVLHPLQTGIFQKRTLTFGSIFNNLNFTNFINGQLTPQQESEIVRQAQVEKVQGNTDPECGIPSLNELKTQLKVTLSIAAFCSLFALTTKNFTKMTITHAFQCTGIFAPSDPEIGASYRMAILDNYEEQEPFAEQLKLNCEPVLDQETVNVLAQQGGDLGTVSNIIEKHCSLANLTMGTTDSTSDFLLMPPKTEWSELIGFKQILNDSELNCVRRRFEKVADEMREKFTPILVTDQDVLPPDDDPRWNVTPDDFVIKKKEIIDDSLIPRVFNHGLVIRARERARDAGSNRDSGVTGPTGASNVSNASGPNGYSDASVTFATSTIAATSATSTILTTSLPPLKNLQYNFRQTDLPTVSTASSSSRTAPNTNTAPYAYIHPIYMCVNPQAPGSAPTPATSGTAPMLTPQRKSLLSTELQKLLSMNLSPLAIPSGSGKKKIEYLTKRLEDRDAIIETQKSCLRACYKRMVDLDMEVGQLRKKVKKFEDWENQLPQL